MSEPLTARLRQRLECDCDCLGANVYPLHDKFLALVAAAEAASAKVCRPISMTDAEHMLADIERTLDAALAELAKECGE